MLEQNIKNLAPLVGTKLEGLRWAPTTGYQTAKALRIASLICLDIDNDSYTEGQIKYSFTNKVTVKTSKIHALATSLDPNIIDTTYLLTIANSTGAKSMYDALFLYANSKLMNDSAIYDALHADTRLKRCPWYRYVLLILLDAFSLRWSLIEYGAYDRPYEYGELGSERLDRLLENIRYVRAKLEDYDYKASLDLCHHLGTLYFNVLAVRYELGKINIEVDRR